MKTKSNRTLLRASMSLSNILWFDRIWELSMTSSFLFEPFCRTSLEIWIESLLFEPFCRTSFALSIKSSREVTEARWNWSTTKAESFPSTSCRSFSLMEMWGSMNFRRSWAWIGPGALFDLFSCRVRFGFGGISESSVNVTLCWPELQWGGFFFYFCNF